MSSAKTPNLAAFREERVILGVVTEELFSALPFRLFFADFLVVQKSWLPLPMGDFSPSGLFPIYLCIASPPFKVHHLAHHSFPAWPSRYGNWPGISWSFKPHSSHALRALQSNASQSTFPERLGLWGFSESTPWERFGESCAGILALPSRRHE